MNDLQRTAQWHADRLGKLTGSRIADATARIKTGWSAMRENYMAELLCERLTGQPTANYVSKPMQDGIDREPEAIAHYEFEQNVIVELVGFLPHCRIAMAGCSSDGLVGETGAVSIKCPLPATHVATLLGASIDGRYTKQNQWELGCLQREWIDWVSYCPLLPVEMQYVRRRVLRDDKMIAQLEKEGEEFLAELAEKHRRLLALVNGEDHTTLDQLKASVEMISKGIYEPHDFVR